MAQNPSEPSSRPPVRHRVLIVEDDTLVGMGLLAQLEKLGHVVVGHASTCAQAQKLFSETKPDLILIDIRLDGGDGIELVTQLLKERRCPALILSAYSDRDLIERASMPASSVISSSLSVSNRCRPRLKLRFGALPSTSR